MQQAGLQQLRGAAGFAGRALARRPFAVVAAQAPGRGPAKGDAAQQPQQAQRRAQQPAPAAAAASHPTAVPRNEGVSDGVWNSLDEGLVKAAKMEAKEAAEAAKPKPGRDDSGPVSLLGLSFDELQAFAVAEGQPAFRGKQLYEHLYGAKRARSLDDLTQIPKGWREELAAKGVTVGRSAVHDVAQSKDGTAKLLLRLSDGRVVETVGIPAEDASRARLTACVSSQVGCPMRCTFCATGKGGFARNLKPHEIVDQILSLEEYFGRRVSHVVFMGMGEPCLNLPGVLAAHRCLNEDVGIGARSITISTVGVPQSLRRLAERRLQSTLAVSLHAPNQELRERLIPSAKAYPLDALLQDCRAYFTATNRRVTFEYTLLSGVNDQPAHAKELAALLRRHRLSSHVNLIPYNFVDDSEYGRPSRNAVKAFERELIAGGCGASVRETRGLEAAAACGQLRNRFQSRASDPAPMEPAAAGLAARAKMAAAAVPAA